MTSPRPLFFRSPWTLWPLSQYPLPLCFWAANSFYLPSCTPHLYPHDPPPSLLLIQRIHNIKRTIHTKNAPTRRYSHTLSYCTTRPISSRFSCPISICALLFPFVPFLSLSFVLPFVLYLPYLYTMLSAFHSVVFHSSSLCSRFCHPSFDLCSHTLFHSHSFPPSLFASAG
ncbi:hypothetical protein EDB86DRAFT_2401670 [Lactarius hatsudake]|nr:hypothetical protein EDB86DRAFT_2401670 [Lactarius hatsudake]